MTGDDDDIDIYMDNSGGASYIESLAKTRPLLKESLTLSTKLDELIYMELELAIMGAEKAKSEILKKNKDDVVRPIK